MNEMGAMAQIWKSFISSDSQTHLLTLPDKVKDSWLFCKENAVSPYVSNKRIESQSQFIQRRKKNKELIELVSTELKNWESLFRAAKPVFVLTDMEGCILWRDGYRDTKEKANEIDFSEGSYWSDLEVGTNAISLALRNHQAVAVYQYEHYNIESHAWNCWAAVIYGADKQPVGVLDVSSFIRTSEEDLMITMIQLIASNVSAVMESRETQRKIHLLEYMMNEPNEGIICDRFSRILKVSEKIELSEEEILGKTIDQISFPKDYLLKKKRIYSNEEIIGYYFTVDKTTSNTEFRYFGVPSQSASYQAFLNQVKQVSKSTLPVHLFGETGTGKEIVAKTVHYNSPMSKGPLISINCGSVSENLLESELFGYAPGAFTGANHKGFIGKIRQADGGTLFLDEIDSMSKRMQSALLRVLEEKQVHPIGSENSYQVNFRLITASNQDLKKYVREDKFRADLFYRIYVCGLNLPPLRDRKEDIAKLIQLFSKENHWAPIWLPKISHYVKEKEWYGNIRELNNFLDRLSIFYPEEEPTKEEVSLLMNMGCIEEVKTPLCLTSEPKKEEKQAILDALENQHYHLSNTAKALGISRSTLYRKMKEYQIE